MAALKSETLPESSRGVLREVGRAVFTKMGATSKTKQNDTKVMHLQGALVKLNDYLRKKAVKLTVVITLIMKSYLVVMPFCD